MDAILHTFTRAHQPGNENGYLLATCLTPGPPNDLRSIAHTHTSSDSVTADIRYATIYNASLPLTKDAASAWLDILVAFHAAVYDIFCVETAQNASRNSGPLSQNKPSWKSVYEAFKQVADLLIKAYNAGRFAAWTVPCMYVAGKHLRIFAIKADEEAAEDRTANGETVSGFAAGGFEEDADAEEDEENQKLEDAGRMLSRFFSCCISDRAPIESSRKWALYAVSNLLFKTYFKLNKPRLTTSIIRSLQASTDTPPLTAYPKSHRATYAYYNGVTLFLNESYAEASTSLSNALALCPTPESRTARASPAAQKACAKNRTLILIYLIPCQLVTSQKLPSKQLLDTHPGLRELFGPVCACLRKGDLAGFDAALEAGMPEFVKRRVYLTLERARDYALRNVLRKVLLVGNRGGGGEKRSRLRIEEFIAGLRVANGQLGGGGGSQNEDVKMGGMTDKEVFQEERDEVECLIANAIYKNLMKGYIAREAGMVVLSKAGAFPGTGV